jgi:hypothetical protein
MSNIALTLLQNNYEINPYLNPNNNQWCLSVDHYNPLSFALSLIELFGNDTTDTLINRSFVKPKDGYFVIVFYAVEWVGPLI